MIPNNLQTPVLCRGKYTWLQGSQNVEDDHKAEDGEGDAREEVVRRDVDVSPLHGVIALSVGGRVGASTVEPVLQMTLVRGRWVRLDAAHEAVDELRGEVQRVRRRNGSLDTAQCQADKCYEDAQSAEEEQELVESV